MQTEASQDCFLLKIYMKMATLPLLLTDVRVKGLLPLTKPTLPDLLPATTQALLTNLRKAWVTGDRIKVNCTKC